MRDKKTNCWPPYVDPPEPDERKFAVELGNSLKRLDMAWDRAPDQERRDAVDDVRAEIRQMMLEVIEDTEKEEL